ncbi:MAG: AraC family transcriptional regulator [Planctomycetota bacterium]
MDFQLVMIDRGSVRITSDGVEQYVGPGEVVCQWPGGREFYRFDPDLNSSHRWVALHYEESTDVREWFAAARHRAPRVRRESPLMRSLFDTAFGLTPVNDPAIANTRTHLAMAYLSAYLGEKHEAASSTGTPLPAALTAMQEAIAQRHTEPLTLDDLAEAGSVSTNHLVRLCRMHLDTTPMRLLWDVRVERGFELLLHTALTIGEIAYRVGFATPFHFSRLFKAKYGRSPRDYRRDEWAGRGSRGR